MHTYVNLLNTHQMFSAHAAQQIALLGAAAGMNANLLARPDPQVWDAHLYQL